MGLSLAVTTLVLLAFFVFWLIYRYGNIRKMNFVVLFVVFIGWYFPFSIVFLMPIDVISAQYRNCLNATLTNLPNTTSHDLQRLCPEPVANVPPEFLQYFWIINYWVAFMLCWLVAPLLQSYTLSGGFTFWQKSWDSIKENLILYAILGVLGAGAIIYIAVAQELDMEALLGLCMAMANAYGLFLFLPFMSYGFVNIPRSLWYNANRDISLKYQQFKAPMYRDDLDEANSILREIMREISAISAQVPLGHKLRHYVDIIVSKYPNDFQDQGEDGDVAPQEITVNLLRKLHYKLMASVQRRNRCKTQWERLVLRSFHLMDIARNEGNFSHYFVRSWKLADNGSWARIKATAAWYWYINIEPYFYRILSLLAMSFSILFIWSECTFSVQEPRLSVFDLALHAQGLDSLGITIITLGSLMYMCLCAYSSLLRLRIFNYFYIVSGHQTDPNSLLFCAAMLCRLTFPLCYNFLFLLQDQTTVFYEVMGDINFLPLLGIGFNVYLPVVIVFIVLLVLLNLTERLLAWFSIKVFRYDQNFDDESIQDGREILEKVRERADRNPIQSISELELDRPFRRGTTSARDRRPNPSHHHQSRISHDEDTAPLQPAPQKSFSLFGWFKRDNDLELASSDTAPLRMNAEPPGSNSSSSSRTDRGFVRGTDRRKQGLEDEEADNTLASLQLDTINMFSAPRRGGRPPRDMFADI